MRECLKEYNRATADSILGDAYGHEFWWNCFPTQKEARAWCKKMGFTVIEVKNDKRGGV